MCAIQIAVDQADRQRLDALFFKCFQSSTNVSVVSRPHFFAERIHPSLDLDRVLKLCHRLGLGPHNPARKTARHKAARNLHDLAISRRRHQPDPRPLALKHRIGRNRRPVKEHLNLFGADPSLRADRLNPGQYSFAAIMRRRRRLVTPRITGRIIEQQQIRKRATNIDAQTI